MRRGCFIGKSLTAKTDDGLQLQVHRSVSVTHGFRLRNAANSQAKTTTRYKRNEPIKNFLNNQENFYSEID